MGMITVLTYTSETGRCLFTTWLNKLDVQARAKVRVRVDRVRLGNFGDCKQLKSAEGVWELRIDYGPGYRVYFGRKGNTLVVLLVGGDKGSQKRDIEKAKRYWQEAKGLL